MTIPGFVTLSKSSVSGSQNYTTPGTYTFVPPKTVNLITVTVNGAGGGAAYLQSNYPSYGFSPVDGGPGTDSSFGGSVIGHGGGGGTVVGGPASSGSAGTATGGDINTTGGGGAGGPTDGSTGGKGGNGGQAIKNYSYLTSNVTVIVGTVGASGGTQGANGSVLISWT